MDSRIADDLNDDLYRTLLKNESVITLFQPIVSVKKKSVIGFEALTRGIINNSIIPPVSLFNMARNSGTALEFDRLCRKKALDSFAQFNNKNNDYLLSVNIDSSVLLKSGKTNYLLNTVNEKDINPSTIIIEILESEVKDIAVLNEFVERYKKNKFLIAIDDIGSGFSNLERVISLRPDIIKLDKFLVTGINSNYYKQEITRSIISMATGIGSIVIAEGIETDEDAITCLELGADYLQGYLFSKPFAINNIDFKDIFTKLDLTANKFRDRMLDRIKLSRKKSIKDDVMIRSIVSKLAELEEHQFNAFLNETIQKFPNIECAYIINDSGIQISDTIFNENLVLDKRKLFKPDTPGTDQSYKNYFFYLKSGLNKFTSDPYISMASGRLCITISTELQAQNDNRYVLCCDIIDERSPLNNNS